jgi:hypothetical protein
MSMLDKLRAEAAALEVESRASGNPIKHSFALELVAKKHGYTGWRACLAAFSDVRPAEFAPAPFEMKRYKSNQWNFSLEIPKRWNAFPAVPANSPYEVVRFASYEDGNHLMIVFREPYDRKQSPEAHSKGVQDFLEKRDFSNFVSGKMVVGSRRVETLDFNIPLGDGIWSCRHYFMIDGSTLAYVLGFGTTKWEAMIGLYDRMAKSFVISEEAA